jgi:hypothetical protein
LRPWFIQLLRVAIALAVFSIAAPNAIGPATARDTSGTELKAVVLRAGPGAIAETAAAIDPADTDHLVVAADPYLDPVRIVSRESYDGGRTWSRPIDIIPPGFAKSYDPSVAVMPGGQVVVVGGASQQGATHCQPGSAIFVARLDGEDVRYSLIQGPNNDTYVDRPRMIPAPVTGAMFVTWTRSVRRGAECLAAPLRSSIMITRILSDGTLVGPIELPSSGLAAPFGSSMTLDRGGSLHVAIRERDPEQADRIVVVSSRDGGRSFSKPEVLTTTPPFPSAVPGLGGFISGIPVIVTDPDAGLTVAWPSSEPNGSRINMARKTQKGRWLRARPPGTGSGYELFPNISYDRAGRLWLLYARHSGESIAFVLRHRGDRWSPPRIVGRGEAGGYIEIGQFLGVTVVGDRILAAIPLDGRRSRLKVFTRVLDTSPTEDDLAEEAGSRGVDRIEKGQASGRTRVIALIVVAAAVLGGMTLRGVRHQSGTPPDTMPASDMTDV